MKKKQKTSSKLKQLMRVAAEQAKKAGAIIMQKMPLIQLALLVYLVIRVEDLHEKMDELFAGLEGAFNALFMMFQLLSAVISEAIQSACGTGA